VTLNRNPKKQDQIVIQRYSLTGLPPK